MAATRAPENAPASGTVDYYLKAAEECLRLLQSTPAGLSAAEATDRLSRYGPNEVSVTRPPSALARIARQFNNVLLYVLLGSAAITALLGHWLDTIVIVAVVLINALVGYIQEGRAERALLAIRALLSPVARVLRDGRAQELPARALVPGDLVLLGSGDRVPADLRLIECHGLEADESVLTGESVPVAKAVAALTTAKAVAERSNLAHAGTMITRGTATGLVIATGRATELGRISSALQQIEPIRTPLLRMLNQFGQRMSLMIIAFATTVALFGGLFRGYPTSDMLIAAVGIAVAAIPEGLPPVVTITLALGVQLMARHGAIVRRLAAVETLGGVSVICADKTGTLTRNEMTVRTIEVAGGRIEVSGTGYQPEGLLSSTAGEPADPHGGPLQALLRAGLNCNDAQLLRVDDDWTVTGDPTEGALLVLAAKAGLDLEAEPDRQTRLDVIPFEPERRFMATLHAAAAAAAAAKTEPQARIVYAKGAPETLLAMCRSQLGEAGVEPLQPDDWTERASQLARTGQRVLALAGCELPPGTGELGELGDLDELGENMLGGLQLYGLVGVTDPPRDEARRSLEQCRSAGIRVKMITGDHLDTARAVGRELGLGASDRALSGEDLDALDDDAFAAAVVDVDVFARTSPEHKIRLVRALQAGGSIVAMTGDGVNDAPALKRADIGIAMGRKGTAAAREAAEMVLTDDNFTTIVKAVETGRTIDDNAKKSVAFLLPTSIAEALMIAAAIVLGYQLPITPVQVLWVNMVTAVTLGLALAFERAEPGVMQRPPRRADEALLSGVLLWRTCFVSVTILAAILLLHLLEREDGGDIAYARTAAVNALVWFEAMYLLATRQNTRSAFSAEGLLGNRVAAASIGGVLCLQLLFTYAPPFQLLFESTPLRPDSWVLIGAAGVVFLLVVEGEKWLQQRFLRRRRQRLSDAG